MTMDDDELNRSRVWLFDSRGLVYHAMRGTAERSVNPSPFLPNSHPSCVLCSFHQGSRPLSLALHSSISYHTRVLYLYQVAYSCPSARSFPSALRVWLASSASTYYSMPPRGAKGGKSKISEAPTEAKIFQTRSAKAGLQVCHVPCHASRRC